MSLLFEPLVASHHPALGVCACGNRWYRVCKTLQEGYTLRKIPRLGALPAGGSGVLVDWKLTSILK